MIINKKIVPSVVVLLSTLTILAPLRPPIFKIGINPPVDITINQVIGNSLRILIDGYFAGIQSKGDYIIHAGANYHIRHSLFNNKTNLKWPLASLSKQFTGYLVSRLIEGKKLNPETSIDRITPRLKNISADCTIDSLSRHKSGIDSPTLSQYWHMTSTDEIDHSSMIPEGLTVIKRMGENKMLYSDYNYVLLRVIVDSAFDYNTMFDQEITRALSMNDTSLDVMCSTSPVLHRGSYALSSITRPYRIIKIPMPIWNISPLKGAVGVTSSVDDLYTWYRYLMYLYKTGNSLSKIYFPEKDACYRNGLIRTSDQGSKAIFHHGGLIPGFASFMLMDFERDIFIVYITDVSVWKSNYNIDEQIINLIKGNEYSFIIQE